MTTAIINETSAADRNAKRKMSEIVMSLPDEVVLPVPSIAVGASAKENST